MTKDIDTTLAMRTIPLAGPIYDENTDYITIELRDFSEPTRTAVLRFWFDGAVQTVMVDWENLTHAVESIKLDLLPNDWDQALVVLAQPDEEE